MFIQPIHGEVSYWLGRHPANDGPREYEKMERRPTVEEALPSWRQRRLLRYTVPGPGPGSEGWLSLQAAERVDPMNNELDSATEPDRLDEVLAEYMEGAETLKDNLSGLCALQQTYLDDHPDLAPQLITHFENESAVLSDLGGIPCRLPDFGRYSQIKYLGHGGMGVVYKAYDTELKISVALKMTLPGHLITAEEVSRFRVEAQSMAKLRHPNIVRVFDVDEHDGRPFLSMELVEGGSLNDHLHRFAADPRSAAELMVNVARAVHHAHQRRILHRDLKPANILLDKDDRPYVTDFGLAKPIGADGLQAETTATLNPASPVYGTIAGTAGYMSAEQAYGKGVTTLSDVYGLGAILYALQTAEPPFRGETVEQTLQQVRDRKQKPKPPREKNPDIDRTPEAICLKCLRQEPGERYRSAEGLAKDLERWLAYRPTEARPPSIVGRSRLWSRRNPVGVGLAVMAVAFLTSAGLDIAERLQEPARAQMALARQQAGTLHLRLTQLSQAVAAAAGAPEVSEFLTKRNLTGLQAFIEETGNRRVDLNGRSPFESWFIIDDLDGEIVGRWPAPAPQTQSKDRRYRDYYKGALHLAKTEGGTPVYVSRVYKSFSDDIYKFGISAAVRHGEQIVGAIVASVTTSPQMGLPQTENSEFTTALLARQDSLDPGGPRPLADISEFLVLLHPAYERRTPAVSFPKEQVETTQKNCADDYYDPVASLNEKYAGRWIACIAAVEDSEFIVVVQRRYSQAIPTELWFVVALGVIGLFGVLAVRHLFAAYYTRRRTQRISSEKHRSARTTEPG